MARPARSLYRLNRRIIRALVRPRPGGAAPDTLAACALASDGDSVSTDPVALTSAPIIYVLENRSLSDLIALDLITAELGLPEPFAPIQLGRAREHRRFYFLNRPVRGRYRPARAAKQADRLAELLSAAGEAEDDEAGLGRPVPGIIVPVAVIWGRSPNKEGSLLRLLLSEHWAVTSRLKRFLNVFLSRREIIVHFGQPVVLAEILAADLDGERALHRINRLLRIRLRNQRVALMGPDLSHQRTLTRQILQSRAVRQIIEAAPDAEERARLDMAARKHARAIASNLSYPTIRILEHLLRWFWNRIYQGLAVDGIERVKAVAEDHTLVYLPSHRSHVDYLLLSYLVYQHGLMIPHIAAGDNLNLPILGNILRRGGAFFMRRSFRDDPLYAAVFSEYLYQVYRRGHSVEFFPEGGRTRTGRVLPARVGLIKMTLEHQDRGLPRPLVLVPVYFGYEKLIEAASYLDELRGAEKKRESWADLFRSLRLIRQNFGRVAVRFGEPLHVTEWLESVAPDRSNRSADATLAPRLGVEIMRRINATAAVNPMNLVALVTLCTPRLAIEEPVLADQIETYQRLLAADAAHHDFGVTDQPAAQIIAQAESLGMLHRESTPYGAVLSHDPLSAVLVTWYRNNVTHVLALPSLVACFLRNRRRPIAADTLQRMVSVVLPYISEELTDGATPDDIPRWLDHLAAAGLVEVQTQGRSFMPPPSQSTEYYRLRLLARVIMPVLERLFIVVGLLHLGEGTQTRESLQTRSSQVAEKMSRLYGLNAPEFFDTRLFDQFVDALLRERVITVEADGYLRPSPIIEEVLRAAETIIDPDFRLAVLLER